MSSHCQFKALQILGPLFYFIFTLSFPKSCLKWSKQVSFLLFFFLFWFGFFSPEEETNSHCTDIQIIDPLGFVPCILLDCHLACWAPGMKTESWACSISRAVTSVWMLLPPAISLVVSVFCLFLKIHLRDTNMSLYFVFQNTHKFTNVLLFMLPPAYFACCVCVWLLCSFPPFPALMLLQDIAVC